MGDAGGTGNYEALVLPSPRRSAFSRGCERLDELYLVALHRRYSGSADQCDGPVANIPRQIGRGRAEVNCLGIDASARPTAFHSEHGRHVAQNSRNRLAAPAGQRLEVAPILSLRSREAFFSTVLSGTDRAR